MRVLHWFRNDLRLDDNTALRAACARADELIPVFVVDPRLVRPATSSPSRLRFLEDCLQRLARELARRGCPLILRFGDPVTMIAELLHETRADLLVFNRDYSPYARARDAAACRAATRLGVRIADYKDRVVFEPDEIRTGSGGFYRVYSPYRRAWWARWDETSGGEVSGLRLPRPVLVPTPQTGFPFSFERAGAGARPPTGGEAAAGRRLRSFLARAVHAYERDRDRPAVDGTSRLSPHLRFGTISARRCIREALECSHAEPATKQGVHRWINELIWREFYHAILAEEPRVLSESFRPEFKNIEWDSDDEAFAAWCRGETGYPFVDAGMRQLRQTGWMHNRARMVTASFLVKDLLIDWRRGERYFFRHLVDADPASNNGGWQWAASTGTDAQPYFRIFNPAAQGERFDPDGAYVRRFVPELADVPARYIHCPWKAATPPRGYPRPIVNHSERRALALERFRAARSRAR